MATIADIHSDLADRGIAAASEFDNYGQLIVYIESRLPIGAIEAVMDGIGVPSQVEHGDRPGRFLDYTGLRLVDGYGDGCTYDTPLAPFEAD
jgi:hypothetical protein